MTQPGGGSFAVDIAQAPKAIRELEEAREELQAIKRDATLPGAGQSRRPATRSASTPHELWDRSASEARRPSCEALTTGIDRDLDG